ncbi:hypothetical protein MXB_852 [Myxobolus squamalis]|nr:hypothetical protein MXB_852 [Myxobolus squamalis]
MSEKVKAEIKECPIFKPDLSNQAQDIPDLQKPGDQRSRKRKQREEEKIANAKSIILSLESSDSKKENEDGALDNISYFFMRRLPTGVAITPITDWYSAVPCITYPTLNESEAELEFGRRDHVDSVYPKIIKKKSGTAEENESDIQLQNKVALGQVNKLTQKFLKDKGDQFIDNTLSGSESEDDELNEQGKELKKMLEKLDSGNESSDEAPESNLDSGSEEDIDQLEKKYSKSKIFQPDKKIQGSLTDKPEKRYN